MEVRCCCTPRKLLGYLLVRGEVFAGERVKFVVAGPQVRVNGPGIGSEFEPEFVAEKSVILPVDRITVGRDTYLALKSEETPIEVLRQLPEFVEVEL